MNGHLDLIPYSNEKESSFSAVDGDLSDQFIEALGEELFSVRANTGLTGLTSLDSGIKLVLEVDNVDLGGGLGRDVTHPQGTAFRVLAGRQDRVQVVLISLLLVFTGLLHLIHGCLLLALGFLVGDAGGYEHGIVVADK